VYSTTHDSPRMLLFLDITSGRKEIYGQLGNTYTVYENMFDPGDEFGESTASEDPGESMQDASDPHGHRFVLRREGNNAHSHVDARLHVLNNQFLGS